VAVLLAVPAPPMFAPDDAQTVQALVAKGAFGGGVLETDDCQATYERLKASGVTFLQNLPSDRMASKPSSETTPATGSASPNARRTPPELRARLHVAAR